MSYKNLNNVRKDEHLWGMKHEEANIEQKKQNICNHIKRRKNNSEEHWLLKFRTLLVVNIISDVSDQTTVVLLNA